MKFLRRLNSGAPALRSTKVRPGRLLLLALMMAALLFLGAQNAHEAMAFQTETINLNTGYDQYYQPSPRSMNVGEKDNEWRVVGDPTSSPTEPPGNGVSDGRPADVVNSIGSVNPSGGSNYPNSVWISVNPTRNPGNLASPTPFKYAFYFTLPPDFSGPQLTMKLNADDRIASVELNSCFLYGPGGTGGGFGGSPLPVSSTGPACFNSGPVVNVLTVTVEDTLKVATGLIVAGTVTYECCERQAVKDIPGLDSITFWESTSAAPLPYAFGKTSTQLTTQLSDAQMCATPDFVGAAGECYDVFYSNWNGDFNPVSGQFVTIEAVWPVGAPSGGGLNLAAAQLNYTAGAVRYADFVSSFVALGDNALPSLVGNAVDGGNLLTDTTMGNTSAPPPAPDRLRVTVGFPCKCVTPPAGLEHWWPLDETSGSIAHDISGGRDGGTMFGPGAGIPTPLNSGTGPASLLGQEVANSLAFGGSPGSSSVSGPQSFVSVSDGIGTLSYGNPNSAFTIDAWIRIDPADAPGVHTIVDKRLEQVPPISPPSCPPAGPEKHLHGYSFYVSGGNLGFELADNSAPCSASPTICATSTVTSSCTNYTSGLYVATGNWVHVAATVDRTGGAGVINLYANGGPPATFATLRTGNLNNSAALLIGKGYPIVISDTYFKGDIDEVEIFNRALAQSEIESIFFAGSAGKCKPPSVGGTTELRVGGSDSAPAAVTDSGSPFASMTLAAIAAAALAVLGAGLWYGRRRWFR